MINRDRVESVFNKWINFAHVTFPRASHTLHVSLGVLITQFARCLVKKKLAL